MTVYELAQQLNLQFLTAGQNENLISGCYAGDMLSLALNALQENHVWITVQTHATVIAIAELKKVACIILTEGREITENIRLLAEEHKISMLSTKVASYELAYKIGTILERK